jgi:hypothetical protein
MADPVTIFCAGTATNEGSHERNGRSGPTMSCIDRRQRGIFPWSKGESSRSQTCSSSSSLWIKLLPLPLCCCQNARGMLRGRERRGEAMPQTNLALSEFSIPGCAWLRGPQLHHRLRHAQTHHHLPTSLDFNSSPLNRFISGRSGRASINETRRPLKHR